MNDLPIIANIQKQIDELGIKIKELEAWMNEQMEEQLKRAQVKKDLDNKIEELIAKQ